MLVGSVTIEQKKYWNLLCSEVGCIACMKEGNPNDWVSIHHIEGRTKKDAHWLVLSLCASHHQDNGMAIAVHPYKKRFENRYGNQYQLMSDSVSILKRRNIEVPKRVVELIDEFIFKGRIAA
ncbi:Ref family recombination enhancement nuclease [Entomomonas asaccharolytica]|uniref:Recombinase n=1 Tax=Entomomonas asaccharolytica TaxID=2785331 RepID=A0A974NHU6_9GAMM|nr:Ref family recombination enhancement nuclease [Entomomonas asaccharolytica]QQP86923.1 recombinase [Entomomonas asaccharolytica]